MCNIGVMMGIPKGWMTIEEFGEKVEAHRVTVCRWIREGRIKSWKPKKLRLIHQKELEKFNGKEK